MTLTFELDPCYPLVIAMRHAQPDTYMVEADIGLFPVQPGIFPLLHRDDIRIPDRCLIHWDLLPHLGSPGSHHQIPHWGYLPRAHRAQLPWQQQGRIQVIIGMMKGL